MKKFWMLMAVLCSVIGLTSAAAELASYAPEGTDVIIYTNARQFAKSRTFGMMMQQYPKLKAEFKKFDAEAQKEVGISLPQLLNAEYCLFLDTNKIESWDKGELDVIARAADPIVMTFFERAAKENAPVTTIDGKRVLKDKNFCLVEMAPNMAWMSGKRTTPEIPRHSKLATGINTDVLFSAVVDCSELRTMNMGEGEDAVMKKALCGELRQASAHIRETSDGLRAEIVAEYDSAEAAQKAHAIVSVLSQMLIAKLQQESPETAQMMVSKLKLQLAGSKIILSAEITDKELWDAIDAAMTSEK